MGGIFSKTLSSAFTKVGDVVGQAGNIMGGILGRFDGGQSNPPTQTQVQQQMA